MATTDPAELIQKDHRMVEDLFKQYDDLEDDDEDGKSDIAYQICEALTLHAEMEEKEAYPIFKKRFDDEDDKMVEEAYAEHGVAKQLIADIESLEPSDEQFDAKMTVLKESIEHHVKEEEHELLPAAKKEIPEEEWNRIGEKMLAFKKAREASA